MSEDQAEYDTGRVKLKPCPCGAVPEKLRVAAHGDEAGQPVAIVWADCCGYWLIEFDILEDDELPISERATLKWNEAPRLDAGPSSMLH